MKESFKNSKLYSNLYCLFGGAKRIRLHRVRKLIPKVYPSILDKEKKLIHI